MHAQTCSPEFVAVLRERVQGPVYLPSDGQYRRACLGSPGTTPVDHRKPAVVVLPETPEDVRWALDFAREQNLELSARSAGHDVKREFDPDNVFRNNRNIVP